ncbi:MAG: NAD(P)/FAD-dependent oxidoreductase [Caldilineaceae bacterium]|nr:NAD(P)/FAD-dependent oxidoreductase [Caldilineaceae bacterium]
MTTAPYTFDVAIIGSGIGGSTLAAVLARQGLSVIVFEGGAHPRFTIGESMILETSEAMRALAEFYDVPELAYFSSENFYPCIGTSHGVKRHFSFLHHTPGQRQNVRHSLQAVIPKLPYGHEIHIHRQDSDYLLTAVAISYGATVLQGVQIQDIHAHEQGVEVLTTKGATYWANYVIDAGGMKSLLANKFNWRHRNLLTHSRTIFTHMIDVPCFNNVGPSQRAYGFPYPVSQGTLHHIFKGGWLWVIPFNNHSAATNPLCSVGLQLDPRLYPQRDELSPAQEFFDFVGQFPDLTAQLRRARPVRDWMRIDRLQYSASHIVGDRFALLAHAAGFIDPLFSKGLYVTHASIFLVADLLLRAKQSGDYSAAAFVPLETMTLDWVNMHDRLVASSYKSWANVKLWQVYAVLWLLGAYLEYVRLVVNRLRARSRAEYVELMRPHRLAGGGFEPFFVIQEQIDALIDQVDPDDEADVERTVAQIRALFATFPWMPSTFHDLLQGKTFLPDNKLRPNLLAPGRGFLGDGVYRQHFFGANALPTLLQQVALDTARYSRLGLTRRRRTQARLAEQTP